MRASAVLRGLMGLAIILGVAMWPLSVIAPRIAMNPAGTIGVTFLVAAFMLPASMCMSVIEERRHLPLMVAGLVSSFVALAWWAAAIWAGFVLPYLHSDDGIALGATLTAFACFAALEGLITIQHGNGIVVRVMRWIARGGIGIVFLQVVAGYWTDFEAVDDRVIASTGIIAGSMIAVLMIVARSSQLVDGTNEVVERLPFRATCPRCGSQEALITGGDACSSCGLTIRVVAR